MVSCLKWFHINIFLLIFYFSICQQLAVQEKLPPASLGGRCVAERRQVTEALHDGLWVYAQPLLQKAQLQYCCRGLY
jgi:hypothetical protein